MSAVPPIQQSVDRLRARIGSRLRELGTATVDPVSVRRFREALGLNPDPALGAPVMMVAHVLRADADVSVDRRPSESIDAVLADPVNGGTEIRITRPLRVGETIRGEMVLADAYLREGRSGALAVVITESRYTDTNDLEVATLRATMVYRGVRP
jgi:N-terminal half of MaoC dehydratase